MTPESRVLFRRLSLRRARLFIRDYWEEFPIAWSLARMRDCERIGGHFWGPFKDDEVIGYSRRCSKCGTGESVPRTQGTAATTVWVDSTNVSGGGGTA